MAVADAQVRGQDHDPGVSSLPCAAVGLVHQSRVVDVVQVDGCRMLTGRLAAAVEDDCVETGGKALAPGDGTVVLVVIENAAEDTVAVEGSVSNPFFYPAQAEKLFGAEKVFVNGRVITDKSTRLKEGDILSVRGFGKAIYDGIEYETKKSRLWVSLRKYI